MKNLVGRFGGKEEIPDQRDQFKHRPKARELEGICKLKYVGCGVECLLDSLVFDPTAKQWKVANSESDF